MHTVINLNARSSALPSPLRDHRRYELRLALIEIDLPTNSVESSHVYVIFLCTRIDLRVIICLENSLVSTSREKNTIAFEKRRRRSNRFFLSNKDSNKDSNVEDTLAFSRNNFSTINSNKREIRTRELHISNMLNCKHVLLMTRCRVV